MEKLRQAILGQGNRANSIMGGCMVAGALCLWLATGDLDGDKITTGVALLAGGLGLALSRGGGTGSDAPPTS